MPWNSKPRRDFGAFNASYHVPEFPFHPDEENKTISMSPHEPGPGHGMPRENDDGQSGQISVYSLRLSCTLACMKIMA